IFRKTSVSGQNHRPTRIIDTIAKRRIHRRVVDVENCNLYATAFVYETFGDVLCKDNHAVWGRAVIVQAYPNVILECLFEQRHHALCSPRTPHRQRSIPAWCKPAGKPQVRKAHHMVRVQMREKDTIYFPPRCLDLIETLKRTAPGVKNELLSTGFDQDTWPEPVHDSRR